MVPFSSGSGRLPGKESHAREILGGLPAGGILICGTDLRVRFATGHEFGRLGIEVDSLIGNSLPDVTPAAFWRQLLPAFETATAGRITTLDIEIDGENFAIQVSPIITAGEVTATLTFTPDSDALLRHERSVAAGNAHDSDARDRQAWSETIESAIADDRMTLLFQPILNLGTGEVEQHELLIRMRDEADRSKLVLPGAFLPEAERLGLTPLIDRWVVSQAIEIARRRPVEINLSAITVSDPTQVAEIEREIVASGVPPENITFEITETAVAENMESARRFAEGLKYLGCSFALDDFGVGFGTFTYLKHLPVDFLKIDIEFVRDLVTNDTDRQVVNAIVGAARLFKMKTIAEGVEDQATLDLLSEMSVDYAQGYWIGRPGPVPESMN